MVCLHKDILIYVGYVLSVHLKSMGPNVVLTLYGQKWLKHTPKYLIFCSAEEIKKTIQA